MPYLDHAGNTRELPRGDTLVGSGTQAAWRLQNDGLAPRHFVLRVGADGAATLEPHAASTVVTINGARAPLEPTRLADGDAIAAGAATMVFLERLPESPAPRPSRELPGVAFLLDERGGVAHPLDRAVVTIGRDARSDIVVRDPAVSRSHAEVRAEAGARVLRASGSGGTRVNGARASVAVLEEGDVVEVGGLELRYTMAAPPASFARRRDAGEAGAPADELSRRSTVAVRMEELVRVRGARGPWWIVAALLAFAIFTAAVAAYLLR